MGQGYRATDFCGRLRIDCCAVSHVVPGDIYPFFRYLATVAHQAESAAEGPQVGEAEVGIGPLERAKPTEESDDQAHPEQDSAPDHVNPKTVTTARTRRTATSPQWEEHARTLLRNAIKRYRKTISTLVDQKATEAQTRLVVTEFLRDGLGFDLFRDIAAEYPIEVGTKGGFADIALRIDDVVVALIEVKAVTTKLPGNGLHLMQGAAYAIFDGIEWVILTNAREWVLYHVQARQPKPAQFDLIFHVDLLDDRSPARKATDLIPVTREHIKHGLLDELWERHRATSPKSLGQAVLSEQVLKAIRSQLHKTKGRLVELDELETALRSSVLRPESFAE